MNKPAWVGKNAKILIVPVIAVLLIVAVFLSIQPGGSEDKLSLAIEGGELTLTSVGRNHESLSAFVQEEEENARELVDAARVAAQSAKPRLDSAKRVNDEYIQRMVGNFETLAAASNVMSQGIESLLLISPNMTSALDYYSNGKYERAANQSAYCLFVMVPLLSSFRQSDSAVNAMNIFFVPSGQRDRMTLSISQYKDEMETYNQYILMLQSLLKGKDYLRMNEQLEEYMRQIQSDISNGNYESAQQNLQAASQLASSMKDPGYQEAADQASQLNPSQLSGKAANTAQELRNKLRNLEGLDDLENYLRSLQKYLEALDRLQKGNPTEAQQALNEGLSILSQGQGKDEELQGMYDGLEAAFNELQLRIKGQPDQG
jgi:hypothetical protein